jgi:tetratricopeptide (TPR) repeat protein
VENILKRMQKLNSDSSLSYFQDANLYYLLLCQTQNLVYKQPIMKNINKAVQLDPFNSNSYLLRAQFELVFGDLVSAQNDAQKGLEISPQNLDDWIFLARIYQIEGNKSEMVSALSQALKNDPGNAGLVKAVGLAKNISDISKFPLKVNLSVGSLQ